MFAGESSLLHRGGLISLLQLWLVSISGAAYAVKNTGFMSFACHNLIDLNLETSSAHNNISGLAISIP